MTSSSFISQTLKIVTFEFPSGEKPICFRPEALFSHIFKSFLREILSLPFNLKAFAISLLPTGLSDLLIKLRISSRSGKPDPALALRELKLVSPTYKDTLD